MNNRLLALLLALLGIAAFFALRVPDFGFISARNLSLLMIDFAITATLAIGMLLVILPGHIDLSAGSGVGLIGGIAAVLVTNHQMAAPLAMLLGLAAALVLWCAMGTLIVRQRIPAFIITLGGLLVFKGLFWLVIHNQTQDISVGLTEHAITAHWAWLKDFCGLDSLLIFTFYLPYPLCRRLPGARSSATSLAAFVIFVLAIAHAGSRAHGSRMDLAADDGESRLPQNSSSRRNSSSSSSSSRINSAACRCPR